MLNKLPPHPPLFFLFVLISIFHNLPIFLAIQMNFHHSSSNYVNSFGVIFTHILTLILSSCTQVVSSPGLPISGT